MSKEKKLSYVPNEKLVDIRFCCDIKLDEFIDTVAQVYKNPGIGIGVARKVSLAGVGLHPDLVGIATGRFNGRLVTERDRGEYRNRINRLAGNDIVSRLDVAMSGYYCKDHLKDETR
jgi:hypothetical protein